ncbi:NUDIX hydrolase [Sphaerisporangium sp. TRM90804]|uniref:NUDIX hydrolase n=1 Tax=Sphaerisporangium sp. TRM90804 TaxID=3031113 RepID=UPI00244B58F1|nr:NUDIX hydrolase [Sphaerisporangium sp. TRM90804]MDH2428726.1 NUDIX hydrolase [Sphaerisporangium sp. TRM90804]
MTEPQVHPTDLIHAGGAIVWRGDAADPEVALVHRPKHDDWSFPKGKIKPGEHVIAGAMREVAEETGLSVRLGRHLPPVHYLRGWRLKRVDYWVAQVVEQVTPEPSDEVDEVAWLSLADARERLSYEWDAGLLRSLMAAPLDTTPFVLVRHGYAGARQDWSGDDDLRPLDEDGTAQARTIADILDAFRPGSLVSSPSRRCVQTLLPYGTREALRIRTDDLLSETRYDATRSLELALSLMDEGVPTAVCSHGKVLPELITGLCDRRHEGHIEDTHLRKGGVAVLHHKDGRITTADRYIT